MASTSPSSEALLRNRFSAFAEISKRSVCRARTKPSGAASMPVGLLLQFSLLYGSLCRNDLMVTTEVEATHHKQGRVTKEPPPQLLVILGATEHKLQRGHYHVSDVIQEQLGTSYYHGAHLKFDVWISKQERD